MAKAQKLDLHKEHKDQYVARRKPVLVTIPPVPYLTVDGRGEPGGETFTTKVGAMYAAAFTVKMTRKFAGRDYKVAPLEGLWWGRDESRPDDLFGVPRDQLRWKLLIRVPEFITAGELEQAREKLLAKGKGPEVAEVRLERIEEGLCVQMLHVGPYETEPETIRAMADFAAGEGLSLHARHHEIYLSDPRRVPPERLRTILRTPVRKG
jgi:hypothetical protein